MCTVVRTGVDEDSPCSPIGIYGNLKYAAEIIIKSNQVFDIPIQLLDLRLYMMSVV